MKRITIISFLFIAILLPMPSLANETTATSSGMITEQFNGISFNQPVDIQFTANSTPYIVEQAGKIYKIIDPYSNNPSKQLVLSITDKVDSSGGEEGLLGLAFHPDFMQNNLIFVDYTAASPDRTVISRYQLKDDGTANMSSETIILEVDQPYSNHNAGAITFGPDDLMYITLGDGGSGGDPHGNGQDTTTLLGSILRIDITNATTQQPYSIPENNPLVNKTGADELFAWGLRNPWRIGFDSKTGDLFAGDVGQNRIEEVDVIEKGKNYGWNVMEGSSCYDAEECNTTNLTLPVAEYTHEKGNSITGGYVWRETSNSELEGNYIFADYVSGRIWRLPLEQLGSGQYTLIKDTDYFIPTFGIDPTGRLYFSDHSSGKIYSFDGFNTTDGDDGQNQSTPTTTSDTTTTDQTQFISFPGEIILMTIIPILSRLKNRKRE